MITLHLIQDMEQELLPQLTAKGITGVSFYDEKDPLFKTGEKYHITTFTTPGGVRASGQDTSTQPFDIEVRGIDNANAKNIMEKVAEYLQNMATRLCVLPTIPNVSNRVYHHCQILNLQNYGNLGEDNEGKIVFRISAEINYKK